MSRGSRSPSPRSPGSRGLTFHAVADHSRRLCLSVGATCDASVQAHAPV